MSGSLCRSNKDFKRDAFRGAGISGGINAILYFLKYKIFQNGEDLPIKVIIKMNNNIVL
jgi:hypothetical protein